MFGGEFGIAHHYWHEATRTVICVPPKCGSSAIKYALIMAEHPHLGALFRNEPSRVHGFAHLALVKRKSQIVEAGRRLFMVRNPVRRTLSAFLSKFVVWPDDDVLRGICALAEIPPDDMTFRLFVQTVAAMPDVQLDPHFCSQEHFFCLPQKDYELMSVDSEGGNAFAGLLNGIHPGSSATFREFEARAVEAKLGPVEHGERPAVRGRLADLPVKRLRYLRFNGADLPDGEFLFDGCEQTILARYAFDATLNAYALAA
ncbi:sulfotransferase family 2 domain-containing protein [Novosphingobium sp.]|uniref:sulfotransferase family 2 domain-containing protein n=1 Tax=Novosphingobium sp. TaxID=1874826 RepID=UPI003B51BC25